MTIKKVTIAGAGTLGSQIAYQAALNGYQVSIWNPHPDKAKQRLAALKAGYQRDLHLSDAEFEAGMANIDLITDNLSAAVKDTDYVIEAVPEDMQVKEEFYRNLMAVIPDTAIVASNSSTFIPSELVKFVDQPDKFLHMHFANEIWKFNVAEIVGNKDTDPAVFNEVVEFARGIKMVPIEMHKEQHGYILNSLLVPFLNAAMQLWVDEIADPHQIDKDWMISTGAPSGPFMILDVVGLHTPYNISMNHYRATNNELYKRVADKLKVMIDAGHYGRESGQGFYHYPNPEFLDPDFLKK